MFPDRLTHRRNEETPTIEDGELVLPDKPGLGLKFDEKAIASFTV